MDQGMQTASKIENEMLRSIDDAYRNVLSPVLKKHRRTLQKLDELIASGETARARVLWRSSGLLEDLAAALARSGMLSAATVRRGLDRIREAVSHAVE